MTIKFIMIVLRVGEHQWLKRHNWVPNEKAIVQVLPLLQLSTYLTQKGHS